MLKWMLPVTASLLAVLYFVELPGETIEVEPETLVAQESELEPPAAEEELLVDADADAAGRTSLAAETPVSPVAATPAEVYLYDGRLVDIAGRPLPGETMVVEGNLADLTVRSVAGETAPAVTPQGPRIIKEFVTGAGGSFHAEAPIKGAVLQLKSKHLTLLGDALVQGEEDESERLYVAAATCVLKGRVLDADGMPLAGVRVGSEFWVGGIPGFPFILTDDSAFLGLHRQTDEDGAFRFDSFPVVPGSRIAAHLEGYVSKWQLLGLDVNGEITITLEEESGLPIVSGRVLDEAGHAVPGATVLFGDSQTKSDGAGRYELEIAYLRADEPLVAYMHGQAPAIVPDLKSRFDASTSGTRLDLTLRLGGAPRALRGRVVDEAGKGIAGLQVFVQNAMAWGNTSDTLEGRLSGQVGEAAETDSDGRFELRGLFQESYDLLVLDPETFHAKALRGIAPQDEELEISLSSDARLPELIGRVVDRQGRGVPGAQLSVSALLNRSGGISITRSHQVGETDALGAFRLEDLPVDGVELKVHGAGVKSTTLVVDPNQRGELRIEVPLELRFQLDPAVAPGADRFQVVDAAGERMKFKTIMPGVTSYRLSSPLSDRGALPTVEVSDRAERIVFYSGDEVTLSKPLDLRYGEIVRIQ